LNNNNRLNHDCPTCRSPIEVNDAKPLVQVNPVFDRLLNDIEVYCGRHKDKGCEWKGPLANLKDHFKTCSYEMIDCHYYCNESIQRHQLGNSLCHSISVIIIIIIIM
jgi:hypothetical protein